MGCQQEVISEVTVVVETIEAHTHTCADEGEAEIVKPESLSGLGLRCLSLRIL